MKTIGLIGGMSWESSVKYIRVINQAVRDRLGGAHTARCLLFSLDYGEIQRYQEEGFWSEADQVVIDAAIALERGGADFLVICTNTMHKNIDEIESRISIPILHIADATAEVINARGLRTVGLLGTRYTMEEDFFRGRLEKKYGLNVLIPEDEDRETCHRIIFDELIRGEMSNSSRMICRKMIDHLIGRGARGIILGCTELSLLLQPYELPLSIFDTVRIHAEAAVEYALAD